MHVNLHSFYAIHVQFEAHIKNTAQETEQKLIDNR